MAQLSLAIDGIAEACTALGTPITGGNVSLYNETSGEGIYPTPVIGVVGLLDDVTKAVPNSFQRAGDAIILLQGASSMPQWQKDRVHKELGSTDFAKVTWATLWGKPPQIDLPDEKALNKVLRMCADESLVHSMTDISDGGMAVALAKASFERSVGPSLFPSNLNTSADTVFDLFGEHGASVLITCDTRCIERIEQITEEIGTIFAQHIGDCVAGSYVIELENGTINLPIADLRAAFSNTLESQLAAEVVTA